jgi:glutaredoxin 3
MNIQIYSKPNCVHCKATKDFLRTKGIAFNESVLDVDFTREFLLEMYPTAKTFPVVVVDGFHIGGKTEIVKMINEEKNNTTKFLAEGDGNVRS